MTGYGRASGEQAGVSIDVEIRSLNHRYADIVCKIPRSYVPFEMMLRSFVLQHVQRGKVEVTIIRKKIDDGSGSDIVALNRPVFEGYLKIYRERLAELGTGINPQSFERLLGDILTRPGVIDLATEHAVDEEAELEFAKNVLQKALGAHSKTREQEGAAISNDIQERLRSLMAFKEEIRTKVDGTPAALKERIIARLKKLAPEIQLDEARIVQEAAIASDKVDITEELVRLEAHFGAFLQNLAADTSGKRLDFLVQEIGREFNTIGSKAQSADISHMVVSAKVELEKIREQLQNVE